MVYQIIKARKDGKGLRDNYWIIESPKINTEAKLIANEYLESLKLANKSPAKVNKYRWVIEMFLIYVYKPLDELESDDVLKWLTTEHKDKKEKTINLFISVLSGLFKFCLDEEYIEKVLVKHRWRPKLSKSLPKYIDKIDLAKVRLEAEKSTLRNRTIFELLVSSGCRVAEAQRLNIDDVDLRNKTAKVMGKGKKIRFIHFTETCAILLERYINTHPLGTGALFLGRNDNRISIRTIQRIINGLGKKAGLSINITPHLMRNTFATILLSKGAPLEFIGAELGHKNDNTTRIYARLPKEQMVSLYRRYMG